MENDLLILTGWFLGSMNEKCRSIQNYDRLTFLKAVNVSNYRYRLSITESSLRLIESHYRDRAVGIWPDNLSLRI